MEIFTHLFRYNLWANKRLAEVLPVHLADQEVGSSFSSLKKTVYHLWDTQLVWFSRLEGTPFTTWPSKDFTGTFEEGLQGWLEQSAFFADYIARQPGSFFTKMLSYKSMAGDPFTQAMPEILYHITNHGTYHRGQIVTILRTLGFDGKLPSTDLVVYFRENPISTPAAK